MNNQDGIQILLNLCGIFGHHRFFIDKLWQKVKDFKDADEAEILNYFMIAELYSKGLYYCGVGSSWGTPCDKEMCEQIHKITKYERILFSYGQPSYTSHIEILHWNDNSKEYD